MKTKPIISPLFVPANRPDRFGKADASQADAIIIDLEDAVPLVEKESARSELGIAVTALVKPVYVRVNAADTPWFEEDINICASLPITGIMLPKVQSAGDLIKIEKLARRPLAIIGLIESAMGVANLAELCAQDPLVQLAFGSIDYALDLNCAEEKDALLLARSQIVLHSRLANLPHPIDGVTTDLNNDRVLMKSCFYAKKLGFGGKLAIHPRQITTIHDVFSPTEQEIIWAQAVIKANDENCGRAFELSGKMIDRPIVEKARKILVYCKS